MTDDRATIFALSSGRLPAAIAVIRISGPRTRFALETMIGRLPEPRRAALAKVRQPAGGEVIDEGLALWFPGPKSETGEDVAELQVHGGQAVVATILAALGRISGLRLAEPGEFTRRAFENGRLDLTAVEGLADLIYAETEAQRRQAYRQLKGLLGDRAEGWRTRLIEALALAEAGIDFSDEGDVPQGLVARALLIAGELRDEIARTLTDGRRGERLRDGLVVAIAGPPNVGKSSLFNRIAQRDVAIVSPYAGTTRDSLEVHLDLAGYPVTLLDTAGLRESADPVEQEGVRRARARAEGADVVLWMTDGGSEGEVCPRKSESALIWRVRNKIDLLAYGARPSTGPSRAEEPFFCVSALTGEGVDELIDRLAAYSRDTLGGAQPAVVTRERHRGILEAVVEALRRAVGGSQEDLVAEDLRLAAHALGRLTGRVNVEDILDVVFRDFCIGK